MVVHPSRARKLLSFGRALSREWRYRRSGVKVKDPVLCKRRCQPAWLLDRTTLYGAVYIINAHWQDPERMLFLLVALTNGFTNWRNLEVAGGLPFLNEAFEDFDEEKLLARWRSTPFVKKAYDTHESLGLLVRSGEWVDGFVRFLHRWKVYIGGEVLRELYADAEPTPWKTYDILRVTDGMSKMARLALHRMLGLYDKRLFDESQCWDVSFMAQPIVEYVHGARLRCGSVSAAPTLLRGRLRCVDFRAACPPVGFDHNKALQELADYVMANPLYLHESTESLPQYVKEELPTLLQVWCNEWGRHCLSKCMSLEKYYADTVLPYNVLFNDFESKFIVGGCLCPCGSARIWPTLNSLLQEQWLLQVRWLMEARWVEIRTQTHPGIRSDHVTWNQA